MSVVSARIRGEHATGGPFRVELIWSPEDPLTVVIDTGGGIPELMWLAARDLLISGLTDYSGIGSVQVWPLQRDGHYSMHLEISDGDWLQVRLPWSHVQQFLARTGRVIAVGSLAETGAYAGPIDAAIAACLREVES